ncbi:diphthamide synthase (EF-2-diphthine--ammonia ligase) [Cytobacillus purgationiresistens]|uniref:Diphthamide synthase (EF-2-diphthine--ammonia ligase) n=1 Tax=Cytobacillus purgationiresistens TaxID=863449 RepID=A0ABU0AEV5_9BACI|nr:diphthamide synthase (EF-2-diphthine--ammonia ligase) [Cytobacillus purgationiresistens]
MALDKLLRVGIEVSCLVTTMPDSDHRSYGQGERRELIEKQGEALRIPVHFVFTSDNGRRLPFLCL